MNKQQKNAAIEILLSTGLIERGTEVLKRQQAWERELRQRNLMIAQILVGAGYNISIQL